MKPADDSLNQGFEGSQFDSSLESASKGLTPVKSGGSSYIPERFSAFKFNRTAFMITSVTLVAIALIGLATFAITNLSTKSSKNTGSNSNPTTQYSVSSIPLNGLNASGQLPLSDVNILAVNGKLQVNGTLQLTPTTAPTTPTTGQVYYDQSTNQPYYYNGAKFVSLDQPHVSSIAGSTGEIALGQGLQVSGNKLSISTSLIQSISSAASAAVAGGGASVKSIQGLNGDVSFSAGNGIAISGTTISNTGVTGLTSSNSSVIITPNGNGSYDVKTASGPSGVFLAPASAQTDSTNNSTLHINKTGTGNLIQLSVGGIDKYVVDNTGKITQGSIDSSNVIGFPANIVNTIGGIKGAVLLGTGLSVDLPTNTLNLAQDISTTASPTFAGLSLGTPSATAGTLSLANATSGQLGVVSATSPTGSGNASYVFPAVPGGSSYIICLDTGNCAGTGTGATTSGGVQNYISKYTNIGGNKLGNSILFDNGTSVGVSTATPNASYKLDVNGAINSSSDINSTGGALKLNGIDINTAGTLSNVAYLNQANTFTASGTALTVNNNALVKGILTSESGLAVGAAGTTDGSVSIANSTTSQLGIIKAISPTGIGNATYAFPAVDGGTTYEICLNTGNCAGTGTGATTVGGVKNYITKYTAGNVLGNSSIYDNGVSVGLGTSTPNASYLLDINGAINVTGNINQAGASTFSSGTGAVSLNGNTSVTGTNTFTVGSGLTSLGGNLSVVGNINTTTGKLQLNGVDINAAGTLTNVAYLNQANTFTATGTALTVNNNALVKGALTANGGLTVGLANTTDGSVQFANASNAQLGILKAASPTGAGNETYNLPTLPGGTADEVCLVTLGNCGGSGSGVTTTGGTVDTIPKFSAAQKITNSSITDDGVTVTVGNILSASVFSATTIQSTGALAINPGGNLTIGATNHNLTLQGNGSTSLSATAGGFTSTLGFLTPTANRTINLPDAGGTVCLQSSVSCGFALAGSGVTTLNGRTGGLSIADATGAGSTITINDASLTQKGIAKFDSTDFSAAAGVITTIQAIGLTSGVQFGSLGIGTTSTAGDITLTSGKSVYADNFVGTAAGTGVLVNGGANNVSFSNSNGANTFTFPTTGGAGQVICTSGITCASGGGQAVILEPQDLTALIPPVAQKQTSAANIPAIYIDKTSVSGNIIQLQSHHVDAFIIDNAGNATLNNTTTITTLQTNSITPTAGLTIGATNKTFTLQGDLSSQLSATDPSTYTTKVGFGRLAPNTAPTGNVVYNFENDSNVTPGTYYVCTTAGNCAGVGGSVTTTGGTAGAIAKFTSGGNIANSLLSEAGSTINVAGNLEVGVSGSGLTDYALVFNNHTNTNQISFKQSITAPSVSATITVPNVGGTIAVSAAGPLSLDPVTGALTCSSCLTTGVGGGGTSGVTSVNTQTGVLTVADATGSGGIITINDASTTVKGITKFNATNFNDSVAGVINTAQDIATNSSPTFANLSINGATGIVLGSAVNQGQLSFKDGTADGFSSVFSPATLTGNQAISIPNATGTLAVSASGNLALSALGALTISNNPSFTTSVTTPTLTSTGTLTITPGGAFTAGATTKAFTLQGTAVSKITATSGANVTSVGFATPTANRSITFPDAGGTVCLEGSTTCGFLTTANMVTSLDGLHTDLTLADSTGTGTTITINDASTTVKGITKFNATNFSDSVPGVIDTVQGISTGASPTFAGLTLTSALPVSSGGTGASTFAANGIIYGNLTGSLQATAAANNSILVTSNTGVPSLAATLPTQVQGNITSTGALTAGSIASGFGAISTANNITTSATLQGAIVNATTGFRIGGVAAAGHYLRGDGTNYIDSALLASDLSGTLFTLAGSTGTNQAVSAGGTVSILAGSSTNLTSTASATNTITVDIVNNPTFTGKVTSSAGTTGLAITGAPTNSATSSLIQVGSAIAGGNSAVNGGTYLGINAPNTGAGSAADFFNFQVNGTSKAKLDNTGALVLSTSLQTPLVTGASTLSLQSNTTNSITLDSGTTGTVNVGTGANAKTLNIGAVGSTAAADTVLIATSTGAAQNIDIGGTGTSSATSNSGTTVTLQGGASVFSVASANTKLKTYTNSTTALQVQNAAGTTIFNIDTVNGLVGTASTSTASTNSQALNLQTGATNGATSISGNLNIATGNSSSSSSGNISIQTGSATGTNNSGSVSISTANGGNNASLSNTGGNAGAVNISSGSGGTGWSIFGDPTNIGGGGNGGNINITAGAGGSDAGTYNNIGNGGSITIAGGSGFVGGAVILQGGLDATGVPEPVIAKSNFQVQNSSNATELLVNAEVGLTGINTTTLGSTLSVAGGISTSQLASPNAPSLGTTGIAGTTSYTYKVTAFDGNGETLPSAATTIATGNATLTASNYIHVNWTAVMGAAGYRIYRTASAGTPSSTGLIGSVAYGTLVLNDTGIAATTAVPTANTTGSLSVAGSALFKNAANTVSAFQIQNASGKSVLTADTTNGQIILGNAGASGVTGLAQFNYAGQTGSVSLTAANPSSTAYTLTLPAETGTVCTNASTGICTTAGSGFVQLAPGTVQADGTTASSIFINKSGVSGNLLQLQSGATNKFVVGYAGAVTLAGAQVADITTAGATNSTALTVQPGTSTVASGTGASLTLQGGNQSGTTSTGGNLVLDAGTGTSTNGVINIGINNASAISIGKTASAGTVTMQGQGISQTITGAASNPSDVIKTSTNSTGAFQVQNSASTAVLKVDTTNQTLYVRNLADVSIIGSELAGSIACSGTSWTGSGTGPWTYSGTGGNALTCPTPSITAGTTYQLVFTVTGAKTTGEKMSSNLGGSGNYAVSTGNGIFSNVITAIDSSSLNFLPSPNWVGSISSVSLMPITNTTSALSVTNAAGGTGLEVRADGANFNQFVGLGSGQSINWGQYNTASGYGSLQAFSGGNYSTAYGARSLTSNTTGSANTAIGANSLASNITGNFNTGTGLLSLTNNISGTLNSAFGHQSLISSVSGSQNAALGAYSLQSNISGSYNSALGAYANTLSGALSNATVIGNSATVGSSNSVVLGRAVTNGTAGDAVGINTVLPTGVSNTALQVGTGSYNTGTICQNTAACGAAGATTTTVTGVGTTFTANMVGGTLLYADGTTATISGYVSATSITVSVSKYIQSAQSYTIIYPGGLNVSTTGSVIARNLNNSTTALQVQNAAGTSILTADTTNSRINVGTLGTATAQLYVAGSIPTTTTASVLAMSSAYGVTTAGKYTYVVGGTNSFQIFDTTNPASPTSVGSASTSVGQPHAIAVAGRYAYIVNYNNTTANAGSLQIFDISNPNTPTSVGSIVTGSNPNTIAVSGRYAYVGGDNLNGMQVYDIGNPASPKLIGAFGTNYTWAVTVSGRYAYSYGGTLQVYDISNPLSPTPLGTYSTGGNGGSEITVSGRYAYVTDWDTQLLKIIDVNNPNSLSLVGSVSTATTNPWTVKLSGRYAYVAGFGSALDTYDVSNPSTPTFVGSAASSNAYSIAMSGRYIMLAGYSAGRLQVFDTGGAYIQSLESGTVETTNLAVKSSATINGDLNLNGGLAVGGTSIFNGSTQVNGNATFKNRVDSTTAFQVQNASATNLLNADTTNMRLAVNSTATAMSVPVAPTLAAIAGGSLTASTTYYYKITATDAAGGETTASTEASVATTAANKTITLYWTAVTGASGYKIYRSTTSGLEVYLTTVTSSYSAGSPYSDNGSIPAGTATPPSINSAFTYSNSTNNYLQLSVGGNGTPTGQVYIGGVVPGSVTGSYYTGGSTGPYSVAVAGRYLYAVEYSANVLAVFDASNPSSPVLIGSVGTGTNPQQVVVAGTYAYVLNNGASSFQVFNISNPATPTLVSTTTTIGSSNYSIAVSGRYVYIVNTATNMLQIYDVISPISPVFVGKVTTGNIPESVTVAGRYAYVVNGTANTLQVIDVSNPVSPSVVGSVGGLGVGSDGVTVSGRYAYVVSYTGNSLQIVDVSNPASPVIVGSVSGAGNLTAVQVSGRYAYVSNNTTSSFQVFNVANPYSPTLIGSISTGAVSGSFGVAVAGRYAYLADYNANSIKTIDLGGEYAQNLEAGSTETGTLSVKSDANVVGNLAVQSSVSIGQSLLVTGNGGVSGTLTVSNINNPGASTGSELSTGETCSGTNWSGTGPWTATGSSGTLTCTAPASATAGATYLINFTVGGSPSSTENIHPQIGANFQGVTYGTGAYTNVITASSTAGLSFIPTSGWNGTITVNSVVQVTNSLSTLSLGNGGAIGIEFRMGGSTPNTLIGAYSGQSITTASGNASLGYKSLYSNISGNSNTAIGTQALMSNTTGTANTALGSSALGQNVSGIHNTAFGFLSLQNNFNGNNNLGVGDWSLLSNTVGSNNVGVGMSALSTNNTGSDNTGLGYSANVLSSGLSHATVIGDAATVGGSNSLVLGRAVTNGAAGDSVGINTVLPANTAGTALQVGTGIYNTGTITQSGTTTVTGSGTTWTSNMNGGTILYSDGTSGTISGASGTTLTSSLTKTVTAGSSYTIIYPGGLNVSTSGTASLKPLSDTTSVFQIQSASGLNTLNVDTTNNRLSVGAYNTGNATSQLYVGGNQTVAGSVGTGAGPQSVAVSGRYAYVANWTAGTLQIIDVSNVGSPLSVGSVAAGTHPQFVVVAGRYAYVANSTGVQIFDVTNPSAPTSVVSFTTSGNPASIAVSGRYLYVANNTASTALQVVDISNPSVPVQVGSLTMGGSPSWVTIAGRYAYIVNTSSTLLQIVDVGTPTSPSLAGSVLTAVGALSVAVQGRYAYVVNQNGSGSILQVFDVRNPGSPVSAGTSGTMSSSGYAVSVQGRYAYVVGNTNTLIAFDISNPASPTAILSTATSSANWGLAISGRYAYVPNITANTLQIFDLGGEYASSIETGSLETSNLSVKTDANILGNLNVQTGVTVGQSLQVSGNIGSSGSVLFQNKTNSTTAFQVQTSSAVPVLSTDTTNQRVSVGSIGTQTGQLYVAGMLPSAVLGTVATGTNPFYFAVQGKYAYVVNNSSNTLRVVDISNPAAPAAISSVGTGTSPYAVVVSGKYAYVTNNASNTQSLEIFDISNPNSPTFVSNGPWASGARNLVVQGRYAYVIFSGGYVEIYDVTNPANPVAVGQVSVGSNPVGIFAQGRYLYVSNNTGNSFTILDISNPLSIPTGVTTATSTATGPNPIYTQGRYMYVVASNASNAFQIWDVSNPATPLLAGSTTAGATPTGLSVQGRFAYVTYPNGNLQIYDVSNPASPSSIGTYATGLSTPYGIVVSGRYAYVAYTSGIATFDLGGTYDQQLEAGGIETSTLQVNGIANFGNNVNVTGSLQTSQGLNVAGNAGFSGTATFQNKTNSTSAFQIQNTSGTTLLNADTTNNRLAINTVTATLGAPIWGSNGFAYAGGSLAASTTYYYKITAIDGNGGESLPSTEITGTTTVSNKTLYVYINAYISGAVAYKLYRSTTSGAEQYLTTISTWNYYDTGSISTTAISPPTVATGVATANAYNSSVQLSVGGNGTQTGALYVASSSPSSYLSYLNIGATIITNSIATSGRYAFISTNSPALIAIDVSNPHVPVKLSSVVPSAAIYNLVIQGRYLYASSAANLLIYDITNPGNPTLVSTTAGISTNSPLVVSGRYVYIGINSSNVGVIDVSNPAKPVLLGQSGALSGNGPTALAINGHYILAGNGNQGLQAVDVANPYAPTITGATVGVAPWPSTVRSIYVQGRYAYTSSGAYNNDGCDTYFTAIDLSNMTSMLNSLMDSGDCSDYGNIVAQGRFAYVAGAGNGTGIKTYDLSNPSEFTNTPATYFRDLTSPAGYTINSIAINGRYAYGVTSTGYFTVNDIGGAYAQQLQSGGLETGTLNVSSNSTFGGDAAVQGSLSVSGSVQAASVGVSGNSASAFQVQNSAGNMLLTADTASNRVGVNATYTGLSAPAFLPAWTSNNSGGSLAPTTTYYYKITAIDGAGGESAASAEIGLTTTSLSLQMSFYWGSVSGATGYRVYRSTTSGAETYLASTNFVPTIGNQFVDNGTIVQGTATAPSSNTAYKVSSNAGSNSSLQLSVGGNGTPTGQLYVSGMVPVSPLVAVPTNSSPNYVAVSGRYAYVVTGANTLQVFDISIPANPVQLSSVSTGTSPKSIVVAGRYAYVVNSGSSTLQIFDISNPSSPTSLVSAPTGSAPNFVTVAGRYAYVVNTTGNNLQIFDVSNPANPVVAGSIGTSSTAYAVAISGKYAYVVNYGSSNLQVYDVSNPSSISLIGAVSTGTNPNYVTVIGKYAYVTTATGNSMQVFDVTTPSSPQPVSTTSFGISPYSVNISGRYAYVPTTSNILVYDISNPYITALVGTITSPLNDHNVAITGRYAFSTSFSASNMQVYDLGGTYSQAVESGSLETSLLNVKADASVSGSLTVQTGLSVAGSAAINGGLSVNVSQTGYAATITNASSSTSAGVPASSSDGLLIQLGTANASRTTGNYFVGFADTTGTVAGKIQGGASAVAYTTTGADYAEYFLAPTTAMPTAGELVNIDALTAKGVVRSTNTNGQPLAGIVSTSAGFIGNGPLCKVSDTNCDSDYAKTNALVALSGQVVTKVNTTNGPIAVGDPITASSVAGEGAKALNNGYIVGYAEEPLASGSGTITVLVRPEFYSPASQTLLQATDLSLSGNANIGGSLTVAGTTKLSALLADSANLASLNVSGMSTFTNLTVTGSISLAGDLTVNGTTKVNDIQVNGHIITSGTAPVVAAAAAAGSADVLKNIAAPSVTVTGNDTTGSITIVVGANTTVGDLANLTFAKAFTGSPRVVLTPVGSDSAKLQTYVNSTSSTGFALGTNVAPVAGTTYTYNYQILQ